MSFPTSPTNGQVTVVNQVSYQYSSATNSWTRILSTANVITANTIAVNGALTVGTTISAIGNITGSYYFGNGSQLTGVTATSAGFPITSGTSNIAAPVANGNIAITVGGTANVVVFATTGEYVTGVVSASGNVAGGNLTTGGQVTATANITGGNILTGGLVSATGTVTGSTLIGTVVTASGNVTGGNILTGGLISATSTITSAANITGGNVLTGGLVSATANVTGGNLLTGGLISATSTITSSANITGGNILTGGLVSATGTITGTSHLGAVVSVTANITGGNVLTGGLVSATGNVTGNYILGNGAFLSGVITSVANINNGTSNVTVVSSGGNVTVGIGGTSNVAVFATTGEYITGVLSVSGNTTGGNLLTGGLVSATSNVTGGNILTGGQVSATGNGTFGNISTSGSGGNISGANVISSTTLSATANVIGGNLTTGGLVSATGTVTGSTLIGSVVTASGNVVGGNITTAGLISAAGNIIANASSFFIGNGSQLTGVTATSAGFPITSGTSNIAAPVANGNIAITVGGTANVAVFATSGEYITGVLSASGNTTGGNLLTGGLVTATGNVTGGNIVTGGQVTATGNVTSAGNVNGGNLSTGGLVTATGNITSAANVNGNNIIATTIVNAPSHTGTIVSVTGNVTSGNVLTGGLISATGAITSAANITGGNVLTGGVVSATANVTGGNLLTGGLISATSTITSAANITGGNLLTGGLVSATGTVQGSTLIGTVVTATGNVVGGNISTSGIVTAAGNVFGNNIFATTSVSTAGNVIAGNVNTATIRPTSGALTISTASGPINLNPAGNIVLSANTYINNVSYPVQDGDAATKQYVDNFATTGISYHQPVYVATTTTLATTTGGTITYTQPNGAGNGVGALLTTTGSFNLIDTANVQTVGTRILVKDQANAVQNGVYTWANSTNIVRSTDTDEYGSDSVNAFSINDYFFTSNGNVNAGTAFIVSAPTGTITFGTSNITFSTFSTSQIYSANTAAGLSLTGTVFSAKVDNNTTAFDGTGNIIVKASANLTTPNIGAATGTSLNVTANVDAGNLRASGLVSAAGNVTGGNITTAGVVSAGSTVTGTTLIGSVVTATGNITGGNLSAAGNITAGGTISNSTTISTNTLAASTVSATGNVIGGNINSSGIMSSTGNAIHGNILTGGLISATGNITTANTLTATGAATTGVLAAIIGNVSNVNQHNQSVAVMGGNANGSVQFAFQNYSNLANASTDLAIYNNAGTDSTYFIDMGIVSSTYNGAAVGANVFSANDGYLYVAGNSITGPVGTGANVGNLILGATNGQVITWLGNTSTANIITVVGPTGFSVNGVVSATGNITANTGSFFIGNGSQLTGVAATTATALTNGTTNLTTALNGNANLTIAGTSNVVQWATTGQYVTGLLSVSGNVTGGNVLTGGLVSATANVTGGNLLTGGLVSAAGTITGTSHLGAVVSVTANVTGGNLLTGGLISATSTVTGSTLIGSVVTASGNVTGGNILTGGLISATSTITSAANITGGNVLTGGLISATGNVTGNYILGNGAFLTGVITSVANINNGTSNVNIATANANVTVSVNGTPNVVVFANTGAYIAGLVSASGNVTGGNLLTGGLISATANVTGGNLLTGGLISATSTITSAANITGGNLLTGGLISATANVTGGNVLTGGLISATGNITGGNLTTVGLISTSGNIAGGNIKTNNYFYANGQAIVFGVNYTAATTPPSSPGNGWQWYNTSTDVLYEYLSDSVSQYWVDVTSPAFAAGVVANVAISGSMLVNANATYDIGSASQTFRNVYAQNYYGNGATLSGIVTSVANINLGTSNVTVVSSGGNIAASVGGTSNVAVWATTGEYITGVQSVSGNITGGNLTTAGILTVNSGAAATAIVNGASNAVGNIGSASTYFNRLFAQATTALYADLAENYVSDADYEPGTVLDFGGEHEVTISTIDSSKRVAGVVSTDPAHLMNAGLTGEHVVTVALVGRVPVKVTGTIRKGDTMVSAGNGRARADADPRVGTLIGKALEDFDGDEGTIEIVIGKH